MLCIFATKKSEGVGPDDFAAPFYSLRLMREMRRMSPPQAQVTWGLPWGQ